jgi:hypothetical protein
VTNPPSDDPKDPKDPKGSTPVPPRGGKGRPGNRPAPRPAAKGRQARQQAQRRNRLYGGGAVGLAIVAAVIIVVVVVTGGSGAPRQPAPASAVTQMESVPLSTMVAASTMVGGGLTSAVKATGGTLTSAGKPELLFIGAEFCPICGAERWPMTMALMKFGTFTNLKQTHSALRDGNVGTWSYYGSTYTSPYLVFDPVETTTNQPEGNYYKTLEKTTVAQEAVWQANEGNNAGFPFIDFGGTAVLESSQYNPETVYYKSFNSILGSVGSNDNTVGASIDASAAAFTKYICGMTNNQPSTVCSAVSSVSAPISSTNTGSSSSAG